MRAGASWIIVLLVAGAASAIPAEGEFVLTGSADVLAPSLHRAAVDALFCADTSAALAFELRAPSLTVHRFEARYVQPLRDWPLFHRSEYSQGVQTLTNATVTLQRGDSAGWLGATLPPELGALLEGARTRVEPSAATDLGHDEPDPSQGSRTFRHEATGPHLVVGGWTGVAARTASVKLSGIDLEIASDESTMSLATGRFEDENGLPMHTERWLVLDFADADWRFASASACAAVAQRDVVSFDGPIELGPTRGEILAGAASYRADGGPGTLRGALQATFAPRGADMTMELRGDLDSTTLAVQHAASASPARAVPWIVPLAAVALAVVAGAILWARRARDPPPEECLARALRHANARQLNEALAWILRAKRQAPSSIRLLLEEAQLRDRLGQLREAESLYVRVGARTMDGEAELRLARMLLRHPERVSEAHAAFALALAKAPGHLFAFEQDAALRALGQHEPARSAVAMARERLMRPDRA